MAENFHRDCPEGYMRGEHGRCVRVNPPRDCHAVPQHTETVNVPHHIYTQHTQPIEKKWLDHKVQMNQYPVSQETQAQVHPTKQYCVNQQGSYSPCGRTQTYY